MRQSPFRALTLAAVVSLVCASVILRGETPLIQIEDASVQSEDGGWTIGNSLIRYSIGTVDGGIGVRGIEDMQGGRDWNRGAVSDALFRVNGRTIRIGSTDTRFHHAEVTEWWGGVRLDLHYRVDAPGLDVVRSYACYPGGAVIEAWTTVTANGDRSVALSDLNSYTLSIQNGTLNWVTGLETPEEWGGPFTRAGGDLDDGQRFSLGANERASQSALPWFSVHTDGQDFFGSILWSGSWRFDIQRTGDQVSLTLGMPPFTTMLQGGATLEFPHAIFGLTNRAVPEASMALKGFIDRGVRHGRPLTPYFMSNTWYSYGTTMNEGSMLAEMEAAASAGVEQFVVDAGWWSEVDWDFTGNFVHNWGNWKIDYDRFPNGLGYLADRAHQLGMRFGIWVEPERVDRVTLGDPGLAKERFLATSNGRYDAAVPNGESVSGQICLVDQEARDWLLGKLYTFIDEVHPDYLKWDNNFWVNCNRSGHGHGSEDGNFQHHRALQNVLDELRTIYPALDIEACSGGGKRLSLDLLARTDGAWLDDQTGLSARTRHSIEGALTLLPGPYLLSFMTVPVEGLDGDGGHTGDMSSVVRSRMLGMPGISWRMAGDGGMDSDSQRELLRQMDTYRKVRQIQLRGSAILLTPQVPDTGWPGWDAVEYRADTGREAVLMAFSNFDSPESARFLMRGLIPTAVYDVESADVGDLGTATGQSLMEDGIELQGSAASLSHVIFFRVRPGDE